MKIVFMGTPAFAATALSAILAYCQKNDHEVVAVYSQPPRPAKRGQKEQKSPVHELAEENGIPVHTPASLKEETLPPCDVAVVAAYGLLLPSPILKAPKYGCLNIHGSLLPRWRGAAPIHRAIEAGDTKTGVGIMQMEEGLDTGPVALEGEVAITSATTAQSLHDALAAVGADLIVQALDTLPELVFTPQPPEGITYAKKLHKDEGRLDWTQPATVLERKVRAFTPWPGCWFECTPDGGQSEKIKVLAAEVVGGSETSGTVGAPRAPGDIIDAPLTIACGAHALRILTLQRPGKKAMSAADLVRGFQIHGPL